MPWIIDVMMSQGVIAFVKIGTARFPIVINLHTRMEAMEMAGVAVNQEVRLVADLQVEMILEQVVKPIVGLAKPAPEIAKINSNCLFHRALFRKSKPIIKRPHVQDKAASDHVP